MTKHLNVVFSCFRTSTSFESLKFSSSKYLALSIVESSLARRASRDRLAASLFLFRLSQYASSFKTSGRGVPFFRLGAFEITKEDGDAGDEGEEGDESGELENDIIDLEKDADLEKSIGWSPS